MVRTLEVSKKLTNSKECDTSKDMEAQLSTITSKGQVTIPVFIRRKLSLKKGERLSFSLEGGQVKITPIPSFLSLRGSIKSTKPFDIKKMREAAVKEAVKRHVKNP